MARSQRTRTFHDVALTDTEHLLLSYVLWHVRHTKAPRPDTRRALADIAKFTEFFANCTPEQFTELHQEKPTMSTTHAAAVAADGTLTREARKRNMALPCATWRDLHNAIGKMLIARPALATQRVADIADNELSVLRVEHIDDTIVAYLSTE